MWGPAGRRLLLVSSLIGKFKEGSWGLQSPLFKCNKIVKNRREGKTKEEKKSYNIHLFD